MLQSEWLEIDELWIIYVGPDQSQREWSKIALWRVYIGADWLQRHWPRNYKVIENPH